jgi:hypothetical protein
LKKFPVAVRVGRSVTAISNAPTTIATTKDSATTRSGPAENPDG